MTQFKRTYQLDVGPPGQSGQSWTELEIRFEVVKSTKRSDNRATVDLFNLNKRHIGELERQRELRVRLFAGYGAAPQLLFQGRVGKRGAITHRNRGDLVTTLECLDSMPTAKGAARSSFNRHFEAPVSNREVLETIIRETGLPRGHISLLPLQTYKNSVSFMGSTEEALDKLMKPAGFRWSLQDGRLQVLERNEAVPRTAALLTPNTGLVGVPERTDRGVNGRALLSPNIRPGWPVKIESEFVSGFWRVVRVTHTGDARANEWTTAFEAREIKR